MAEILALDAGNTHLSWGRFSGSALLAMGKLNNLELAAAQRAVLTAKTLHEQSALFAGCLPQWVGVEHALLASVNRQSAEALQATWPLPSVPLKVLGQDMTVPVATEVPHPEQVGVDRLLNCLAWFHRSSRPAVIVDFGTAITFDLVNAKGAYCGGLILPGPELISRTLANETSLLPRVEVAPTPQLFGRDTISAIRRGVFGLLRGGVDFHLGELRDHLSKDTAFLATGGGAAIYAPWFTEVMMIVPALTLDGIRLACQLHLDSLDG